MPLLLTVMHVSSAMSIPRRLARSAFNEYVRMGGSGVRGGSHETMCVPLDGTETSTSAHEPQVASSIPLLFLPRTTVALVAPETQSNSASTSFSISDLTMMRAACPDD